MADTPPAPDPATYESPLVGYRNFQAQLVEDWPLANQTVGEIGGWRTYGMEIHRDQQRHEAREQR